MKIYKITYENLTFGDGEKVEHIGVPPWDIDLGQEICDHIHCYYGNHEDGHGDFTAICQEVSRDSDEGINKDIEDTKSKIESLNKRLTKLRTMLETPYVEIGEPITINSPKLAENT